MAAFSGDTSKISKGVNGLPGSAFTSMKGKVSTSKIGLESWSVAMGSDLYNGSSARMAKLRRGFLYGMAAHAAMDAFAHSTFLTDDPSGFIDHPEADKTDKAPKRFEDAKAAAQKTIIAYLKSPTAAEQQQGQLGTIGGIGTFAPAMDNRGKPEGYYLANVKLYAKEANGGTNSSDFNEWFDYIDYLVPLS